MLVLNVFCFDLTAVSHIVLHWPNISEANLKDMGIYEYHIISEHWSQRWLKCIMGSKQTRCCSALSGFGYVQVFMDSSDQFIHFIASVPLGQTYAFLNINEFVLKSLRWRHHGRDSVSNHQPCLLNRLFRRRWKKTPKLRVTGLCAGNSPGTGEFPAQMASNAENVSIWWRHHGMWVQSNK